MQLANKLEIVQEQRQQQQVRIGELEYEVNGLEDLVEREGQQVCNAFTIHCILVM